MNFIKSPVKGMRDYLPNDVFLRESVIKMIRDIYALYGFVEIETPVIDHIENLTNKQGGENETLIFRILKRGQDLVQAIENGNSELSDMGLRYDLTVPLARYYANNVNQLPSPFKVLQIGNVWRADKPQKGRFRQFTQCDIDILGENSIMAEIELIAATADALAHILANAKIQKLSVHISDRNILKAMAKFAGFAEEDYDDVFIILDKFDKIGLSGIKAELTKKGYDSDNIDKYVDIFQNSVNRQTCEEFCAFLSEGYLDKEVVTGLDTIIHCVRSMVPSDVSIIFDPTLVRGMSYYTGTIFECSIIGYGFSIAGGGRYDKMIGKYMGMNVCACGFSIGFERIITILNDHVDHNAVVESEKQAILVEAGLSVEQMLAVFQKAQKLRQSNIIVTVQTMKNNVAYQASRLEANGYTKIEKVYRNA
jgi:histidyl-tRNA synthetase